jgi:hypothetical protein
MVAVFLSDLPRSRHERWTLLGGLLERWFPEQRAKHGVDASELALAERRLGFALPTAFHEWYERYGARRDVWSVQDTLWMPHDLGVVGGVLTFCIENQGVVRWGIRLDDMAAEDPPVVVSDPAGSKTWLVESPTTSAFAVQLAVLNAKWSGAVRYRANGQGTDEAFAAIERSYARLPFPDLNWPAWPTQFYGREDLIIETNAQTWIWATARSHSALADVDDVVREAGMDTWESFEG